jgi:site-specific DNA recombinase
MAKTKKPAHDADEGVVRAVIYARYSCSSQREQSIEGQVADCKAYAERCGLLVVGEYIDRALTGTNDDRPDFQRMIEASGSGLFERVIVWKLDRFARNRYDSALYKHKLKQNGVSVLSAMENIGDGDESIILEAILEASAEYYSRDLSKKVKRGLRESALKGMHNMSSPPYGYMLVDGKAQLDPDRAPFVAWAFEQYAAGESPAEIFREMQRRGIATKHGRPVSSNILGSIFRNEKYTGRGMWGDVAVEWPRIISDEVFAAATARRVKNQRAPGAFKAKAEPYILCGKAFCGYCGAALMAYGGKGRHGGYYQYYICGTKKKRLAPCQKKTEGKGFLEWYVVEQTMLYVLDPARIEYIAGRVVEKYNESFDGAKIAGLEKRIAQIDRELDKTTDLLFAAPSAAAVERINKRVVEYEAQRADLEGELSGLKMAAGITYTVPEVCAWLKQFCTGDPLDPEFRRRIIEVFINSVYVYDDRLVLYFNVRGGKQVNYMDMLQSTAESAPPGDGKAILPTPAKCSGPGEGVRFCNGLAHQ